MRFFFMDIGSTFIKLSVYDSDKKEYLFAQKVPFPQPMLADGVHFTVERRAIDAVILSAMETAHAHDCKKVLISVQMHGYLLRYVDGTMSEYISWQDQSGDDSAAALRAIDFSRRGTRLKKNLPLAKLYPQRDTLVGAEFFTLGSYVTHLLTGKNRTHKTDACASGLYPLDDLRGIGRASRDSFCPRSAMRSAPAAAIAACRSTRRWATMRSATSAAEPTATRIF